MKYNVEMMCNKVTMPARDINTSVLRYGYREMRMHIVLIQISCTFYG